jgi:hypothetical protein
MRRSEPLPSLSPRFVAFAWRYHPRAWFAPVGRGARPWAPGSWCSGSRAGIVGGDGRASQVPGRPLCPYALLLDPGRTEDARPLRRLDMAPARVNNEGSRDEKDFGARSHGLGTGCLRFVLAVTRHDARLASGCLAKLGRAGFCYPQGCDERFPSSSLFPLSQAYPDATTPFDPRGPAGGHAGSCRSSSSGPHRRWTCIPP